jgi:hypothetical protein
VKVTLNVVMQMAGLMTEEELTGSSGISVLLSVLSGYENSVSNYWPTLIGCLYSLPRKRRST